MPGTDSPDRDSLPSQSRQPQPRFRAPVNGLNKHTARRTIKTTLSPQTLFVQEKESLFGQLVTLEMLPPGAGGGGGWGEGEAGRPGS